VKGGVLKEIATEERRVALIPDAVTRIVKAGFEVLVESECSGRASGDEEDVSEDTPESVDTRIRQRV
jgi:alanine dehydrogenase